MHPVTPSTLLKLYQLYDRGFAKPRRVAFDTETSGLHVDEGARVSTVSVAWLLDETDAADWREYLCTGSEGGQEVWDGGIWTLRREVCEGARSARPNGVEPTLRWVISFAWPFDQGIKQTADGLAILEVPGVTNKNLPSAEWYALLEWLTLVGRDSGLTAHNAKFDILQMNAGTRNDPGRDLTDLVTWDTLLGADLWIKWIYSTDTKARPTSSLKDLAKWVWDESESDEQEVIRDYLRHNKLPAGRWDLMPWRVIAKYADQDARLTARMRIWQEVEGERVYLSSKQADTRSRDRSIERGWVAGYVNPKTRQAPGMDRRMQVMRMLTRVERRGVPFDIQLARQGSEQLAVRIEQAKQVLDQTLKGTTTINMAKHYWFGTGTRQALNGSVTGLGLPAYALTKQGAPSVDVATLSKMERDRVPLTTEWVSYKRMVDAKAKWYDGWADRAGADGRMRTSFKQTGTASGRFSVEGIQLQAIPADYRVKGTLEGVPSPRDLIAAGVPQGYELWEMDLAQAELRVAAYLSGCTAMLDSIAKGADLHGDTAKALFHVHESDESWGRYRQVAKRANFSLIFGVGVGTFQETLWKEANIDMPEAEVREVVQSWNRLYPQYREAIQLHDRTVMDRYRRHGVGWIQDNNRGSVRERRWFTTWDIRHYDSVNRRYSDDAHKAFNQRVQPALAQYGQDLWLTSEQWLRDQYGDGTAGLCLMVHDSMVLLLPVGDGPRVTQTLRDMGKQLWEARFPGLPGDLDATRWSDHA